jgi:hypothetical protein
LKFSSNAFFLPAAKPTGLRVVRVVVVVVVVGGGGGQTYFFLFQIKLKSMRHLKILSNKIKIISNFQIEFETLSNDVKSLYNPAAGR